MNLLGLGYGLGGFMKGYDEQQNQQLARQLSQLYQQDLRQQMLLQRQQQQAASLLFPALLGGGAQTPMPGQPSVPQFGGGPFGGGTGDPTPPAAAQPSLPPGGPDRGGAGTTPSFGSGPTFSGIGDYGGGEPPGMGDYYAPAPGSGDGGGAPSPLSGPRIPGFDPAAGGAAPQYTLADYSPQQIAAAKARGMIGQNGLPLVPPSVKFNSRGVPYNPAMVGPGGVNPAVIPGFERANAGGNAQASPTSDIPPAATAPSSPPGFSGSSAAAGPPLSAGDDSDGGGRRLPLSLGTGADTGTYGGSKADYIRQQAARYPNINPNDAIRTVMGEGGVGRFRLGDAGTSGGPFQLHVGGGLGDKFQQQTGHSPLDPRYEKEAIDWTLNYVSKNLGGKFPSDVWHGNRGGGGYGGGANDAILQQAMKLIQDGLRPVPESLYGRMSTQQLARQIENANPNADPVVKMLALERGMKLLAPEDRLATQEYMREHQDLFREGLAVLQSALTGQRQAAGREDKWSMPTDMVDESGKRTTVQTNLTTGEVRRVNLPAGTTLQKPSASKELPPPDPGSTAMLKSMLKAGLNPPSYMARGPQGQADLRQAMKEMKEEGTSGGQLAQARGDVAANKASQTFMTKTYDTVKAYAALADRNIAAAEKMSENVVPTDFGSFLNRWIETGQSQFGDENVPAYAMQVITASNELARVLSASTGAAAMTDSARREAAEMLSPYFSAGQFKQAAQVARAEIARRLEELQGGIRNIRERTAAPGTAPGETPRGTQQQPSPSSGAPRVGDVITGPDGKKYRVLTLDRDGQPDDVELAEPAQ